MKCTPLPRRRAPLVRNRKPIARRSQPSPMRRGPRASLARECQRLWSRRIREMNEGRCYLPTLGIEDGIPCGGPVDAAHLFGKGACPAARLALWNGWPVCRNHHDWYTAHATRWVNVLFQVLGAERYAELWGLAHLTAGKPDLRAIRDSLRSAA